MHTAGARLVCTQTRYLQLISKFIAVEGLLSLSFLFRLVTGFRQTLENLENLENVDFLKNFRETQGILFENVNNSGKLREFYFFRFLIAE